MYIWEYNARQEKIFSEGMMVERRKYRRWMLSTYFNAYEMRLNSSIGHLADISYGGMMLISKQPVETNIVFPIKIDLDKEVSKTSELKVMSRSVRCRKDTDFDYFDIGLKLLDLSSGNLKIIKQLIESYSI